MIIPGVVAASGSSGGGYVGPLDIVPGALAAFSVRALSAANLGDPLFTLRRDSDDATQTFNSDAVTGDAPLSAISTFLNGANGFIAAWKDQSGNGNDVVQANAALQPQWSASGPNSKPTFVGDTSRYLNTSGNVTLSSGACSGFFVFKSANNVGFLQNNLAAINTDFEAYLIIALTSTSATDGYKFSLDMFADPNEARGDSTLFSGLQSAFKVLDCAWEFGSHSYVQDGNVLGESSNGDTGGPVGVITQPLVIGSDAPDSSPYDGYLSEVIMYPDIVSDQNRADSRANIAAYYGITLG